MRAGGCTKQDRDRTGLSQPCCAITQPQHLLLDPDRGFLMCAEAAWGVGWPQSRLRVQAQEQAVPSGLGAGCARQMVSAVQGV